MTATRGGTGLSLADRVIETVAGGDPRALASLIETQLVPCSNVAGAGGPPPCSGAPGNPPEGTRVEAFAYGTCEREWQFDLNRFARRFIDHAGELYAVVRLNGLPSEAGFPEGSQYAVIYEHSDPSVETAHALIMADDAVVAADSLCGGVAAAFLASGPPLFAPAVIYRAPGFSQ